MSEEAVGATEDPGTEHVPPESQVDGSQGQDDPFASRLEEQQASIDLLRDQFGEFQGNIVQALNNLATTRGGSQEQVDVDDHGELTEGKVQKIVNSALQQHGAAMSNQSQRQSWDDKAKEKFPMSDPKFERALRKNWKEQVTDGPMDATHAKTLYHVATLTAAQLGVDGKKAARTVQTKTSDSGDTGLAPTPPASSRTSGSSKDDELFKTDPKLKQQLAFYTMKGNKTKDQIANFKAKALERVKRREARR